jgi:hypothetical protein
MVTETLAERATEHAKTAIAVLLLVLVGAVTLILQLAGKFDIIASLSEIWMLVAAAIVGFAAYLLTSGMSKERTATRADDASLIARPLVAAEPHSPRQLRYRGEVRTDLIRIEVELHDIKRRNSIQFQSWNAFAKPDTRQDDINNKLQFDAIEDFSTVLNRRNDHLNDYEFERLNNECIVSYEKIRGTGFLYPEGSNREQPAQTTMLQVFTRAEIEQKLPFDSFVSQVKRDGELVFLARAFHYGSSKTETIKRLIREQRATVTILMLDEAEDVEWNRQLTELEGVFERPMLYSDMQRTFVALCQLRRELSDEEKPRLNVMGYERTPLLSLIVIDPKTEDAIMQIGNYASGTDPACRLQIVLSRKTRKDVFDRYWDEYLSIGRDASPIDLERIGEEFL